MICLTGWYIKILRNQNMILNHKEPTVSDKKCGKHFGVIDLKTKTEILQN